MSQKSEADSLSREQLYELVWTEPLTKLAKRLVTSNTALAKLCQKHDVPRPTSGHWSRVALGIEVEQPPLPPLDAAELIEVSKFRKSFEENTTSATASRPTPTERVTVAENLTKPHAIVERVRKLLDPKGKNTYGRYSCDGQTTPTILVAKESIPRVLRILDAIYKHWESVGGEVHSKTGRIGTGESFLHISITESNRLVKKKAPDDPHDLWASWEHVPTGTLTLEISGWADDLRKRWSDGKVQRLETVLDKFFRVVPAWLESFKQQHIDEEIHKRQKAKAATKMQDLEKRKRYEAEQIVELQGFVDSWEKSQRIRTYLGAVKELLASGKSAPSKPELFAKWLDWAHWYADSLCPLTKTTARHKPPDPPANTAVSELDLCTRTRDALVSAEVKDSDELYQLERKKLVQFCGTREHMIFDELTTVLTGLGYDMANHHWQKYHW